jgi:sporulation inhibitor KapD
MGFVCGPIHEVDTESRLFQIKNDKKMEYYYLSRSQYKQFTPYLQKGLFVYFKASNQKVLHDGVMAYEIIHFMKIMRHTPLENIVYFDISTIKEGVSKLLDKDTYRLFLDLEFTMPPYTYVKGQNFVAEIIEYGYVLEDANGNCVDTGNDYIRPDNKEGLNSRTFEFLNVDAKVFDHAKKYIYFYQQLKNIFTLYQPMIYVWGKNDYLMMDKYYEIHNLKPLTERSNFINLMQVMKNYYGEKEDIGLYHAYSLFTAKPLMEEQDHNALNDAIATSEIFALFKQEIINKTHSNKISKKENKSTIAK